jgi:hypothetical protein
MRLLVLAAAVGAACANELRAAVQAQMHGESPFGNEQQNFAGTAPGTSIFFDSPGGSEDSRPASTFSNTNTVTQTTIPADAVCAPGAGACPTKTVTINGQTFSLVLTTVGVPLCVPSNAVVAADGTITVPIGGVQVPIFVPGQVAIPCSRAAALAPAIMAVVCVMVSMLL